MNPKIIIASFWAEEWVVKIAKAEKTTHAFIFST